MELVTGHSNSKHISAVDVALEVSGIVGAGVFQLADNTGSFAEPSVQDANTISMPAANYVIDGRHVRVATAETVTIDNGQTGFNRVDLICAHLTVDSDGVESVSFDVLKGAATTGTAREPSLTSPAWNLEATSNSRVPVAKVILSGLTPTVQSVALRLPHLAKYAPTVLFDNPSARAVGATNLAQSASLFKRLRIYYKSDDDFYKSVDVYEPDGKNVQLDFVTYSTGAATVFLKARTVNINGTVINTVNGSGRYATTNVRFSDGSATVVDSIAIVRVEGYQS